MSKRCICSLITTFIALLSTASHAHAAQLADLQPGRNFPEAVNAFGTGRAENLDVGDIDNDGDYDVAVANGGDGAAQDNKVFVNLGGAQAGTLGTFADESSTRFAGVTTDTSRDIEFVDLENDGDLDVFVSNRGTVANGGEVCRAYTNHGGAQGGAIGFFSETTDSFWGTLVSIPPSDEHGVVDGMGPFRFYSTDADFADLDDDGDLDLYLTNPGPIHNGTRDSLIFLNDGAGTFHELWPWADAAADTTLRSIDTDLADLDGDFDIDVFASNLGQSRVFRNNLNGAPGSTTPFTDMTQTALIDTGSQVQGNNTYEVELGDLDGDGDFDALMLNYSGIGGGNLERLLLNGTGITFSKQDQAVVGDPEIDENEADFFDFDSDGDLDMFVTNFVGTNWLYTNGAAQGLSVSNGLLHRNDSALTLAPWPELPSSGNHNQSLDADLADMDNDGDPDILLSNDLNQNNRYYENVLGVPDPFAPQFALFTVQLDKNDGSDTVLHTRATDNAPIYLTTYYDARLIYTVDGGQERCVRMAPQGGMQYRGVIPGEVVGEIAYRFEVTDDNGNTGVSPTTVYTQSGGVPGGLQSLSCGTPGVNGVPHLEASGALTPGSPTQYVLRDAAPNADAILFASVTSMHIPFKQGTLYAFPVHTLLNRSTDAGGLDHIAFRWPAMGSFASGRTIYTQYGIQDATNPSGVSLSNAVLATVP
ncbi:MAG: hypothetical protein DHS20C15_13420 [Planctomycetota bacterium]|nr:MAG: hypothetical protein DHS20C15_13420 [Planctomycetota bacterium]